MALRILGSPSDSNQVAQDLESAIVEAIPGAEVRVAPSSPGHFEIRVVSRTFAGRSRVQQQQLVYAAIAHLMKGEAAPVHAVDRLSTEIP
jgi:acid stress-induced BolA-like protein IbaG/YrbA